MSRWKLTLKTPKIKVEKHVRVAWNATSVSLEVWMRTKLIQAMVHGGMGIQGIAQTPFYRFITSDEGLSQLGIEATEPPKLLKAYETSAFKVIKKGRSLSLQFGDVAALKLATEHPAAGTGNLRIKSWMEWVFDGVTVGEGFVPRRRLPDKAQGAIRLGGSLGGLMLPRGAFQSKGLWKFPDALIGYEDDWFRKNISPIQKAILNEAIRQSKKKLS